VPVNTQQPSDLTTKHETRKHFWFFFFGNLTTLFQLQG